MDVAPVKQEILEPGEILQGNGYQNLPIENPKPLSMICGGNDTTDSDSDDSEDFRIDGKRLRVSSDDDDDDDEVSYKKSKSESLGIILPVGFLEPLDKKEILPLARRIPESQLSVFVQSCKQFWKAGDYEGRPSGDSSSSSFGGMDHVRVHPKFLHSNATSHKWALGAFAELLDNSLDEVCNGATFVNVDMLENKKDGSRMLLVEDNGGGMSPERMRHCMSLGYSAKSKLANTIGQYGNGFKTSTMRLGADVIVFSRCPGKDGRSPTQSIGLLSYTFLTSTGKEDIVVPMLDYEKKGQDWTKIVRSSPVDWNRNVETIVQWSPYSSEADLLHQFRLIKDQGTRVIIYNLWEDDEGELELDFDTDLQDIQIRGVNRDEKKIEMAKKYRNSRHFLTYRHSLRSYSSILYLRRPPGFRIILRGQDVEHHNIVNDIMMLQEVKYKPTGVDGAPKDPNMVAVVKIGFVKDAKDHIDIQGFNVYHKNRLIKPFWRVWNAAGSNGRGVIGVLEANFVEPAHDKQGFERTTVLSRLETKLVQIQKQYWSAHCHKIGYAGGIKKRLINESARESSPEDQPRQYLTNSNSSSKKSPILAMEKCNSRSIRTDTSRKDPVGPPQMGDAKHGNGHVCRKEANGTRTSTVYRNKECSSEPKSPSAEDVNDNEMAFVPSEKLVNGSSHKASPVSFQSTSQIEHDDFAPNGSGQAPKSGALSLNDLKTENHELKDRYL
ncbi:hypothetical protein BVC80_1837g256 [Macleaya cordata]|uniref:Morc S5 domain-containing protein n=1 Tax=Macleaya cordata TaxID=56857 RepID=A0A200R3Y4_MACCD|nr:hypothetical protein BVC80_1837g256 [Macleaya cordata]